MRLEQISKPQSTALLLAEVKEHLRIEHDDENAVLSSILEAATSVVEHTLDMRLIDRTVIVHLDDWPSAASRFQPGWPAVAGGIDYVPVGTGASPRLPIRPISSVSQIEYLAPSGSWRQLATESFILVPGLEPTIALPSLGSWPATSQRPGSIQVTCTAGFGPDWNSVPAAVRQALLLIIGWQYFERGDNVDLHGNSILKASGAAAYLKPFARVRL